MKVLIADLFSQTALAKLLESGIELVYDHALNGESLRNAVALHNPNILVVRSTKVTADIIQAGPGLELIVRAGAGTDNIDSAEASKRGIYVANCPGKNGIAVAELAMGLMISIDRRIAEGVQLLKEGKWRKGMFAECQGLKGRTLGIIGFGNIGKEIAVRARAFGMTVVATDPFLSAEAAKTFGVEYAADKDEVLAVADIITFHVPALPETKGMINSELLAKCKDNVVIINTSRGDIVNEAQLLETLNARPDMWYGCDVYLGEPAGREADFVHPLAQHPRVYGTHHIGASTKQSETAIGEEALRIILKYSKTRQVDAGNCVNLQNGSIAHYSLVIRHHGRKHAVAHALQTLEKANANVHEVTNTKFKQGACTCSINFDMTEPAIVEDLVKSVTEHEDVINVQAVRL